MPDIVSLQNIAYRTKPFQHFIAEKVLPDAAALSLLSWLERSRLWQLRESPVYRTQSFHLDAVAVQEDLSDILGVNQMRSLRRAFENAFRVPFGDQIYLAANKNTAGCGTRVHNDYNKPTERDQYFFTHRFVLYLGREWIPSNGGYLGLFTSATDSAPEKVIEPIHNTGVGISISDHSYHAVSTVKKGERFSLVFSLCAASGEYEPI